MWVRSLRLPEASRLPAGLDRLPSPGGVGAACDGQSKRDAYRRGPRTAVAHNNCRLSPAIRSLGSLEQQVLNRVLDADLLRFRITNAGPENVELISFEEVDWPDECLGLTSPGLRVALRPGNRP
jgi:hypothetical protein